MSKVVTLNFSNYVPGTYVQSEPVYRYDAGRSILCTGISDDITRAEVHFSAQGQDEAGAYNCSIRGRSISCDIPNEYLAQSYPISVYIYVTQDDSTITTYEGRIPVIDRAEPDSYTGDADSAANGILALVKSYYNGTGGLTIYTYSGNLTTGDTVTKQISSKKLSRWLDSMEHNDNDTYTDSDGTVWSFVSMRSIEQGRDESTDNTCYWAKQAMAAAMSVETGMDPEQYQAFLEAITGMDFNGGFVDNAGYLNLTKDGAVIDRESFVPFYIGASFDTGYVDEETGYLHLIKDNEEIEGFTPFYVGYGGGGGGGGGGGVSVVTVTNTTGWLSTVIAKGSRCRLLVNWSSYLDGISTGAGTLNVAVNGEEIITKGIDQGDITIDIGDYMIIGTNTIRVKISDMYGVARTLTYAVKVIDIAISAPAFNPNQVFTGSFQFPFIPNGKLNKVIHFKIDGVEKSELRMETTASGTPVTQTIPAQKSGSHNLEVWATASVSGSEAESNHLIYNIACADSSTNVPIITMQYDSLEVPQYSTIVITWMVYDPNSSVTTIQKKINDKVVSTEEGIEPREYTWSYRAETLGTLEMTIICGASDKTLTFNVVKSEADIAPVTDSLQLFLTANNRSNNEVNPAVWKYGDCNATFQNFNWTSDGWVSDKDFNTVLRVSGDDRVYIPFNIFENDFRNTGATLQFEFETHDVRDYNAEIISCFSENIGLKITAQKALLKSIGSEISSQYKEDEHVRISFVVQKVTGQNRLVYLYINGITSGAIQYDASDSFVQRVPVGITIGSNDCAVDIYSIRVYNNSLISRQIIQNWVADTQGSTLMLQRYEHNDIYDDYGNIVIDKLPDDLPYMVLEAEQLPQYKGDKKTITGKYVDPVTRSKSFTFEGCQINVQGTSSAVYARKNYDLQFKKGFDMTESKEHEDNFALSEDVIPFNRFVLKADVASSEGANNVQLVKLYCQLHQTNTVYIRPEILENPKVRMGIYGYPIVVFWKNASTGEVSFLG